MARIEVQVQLSKKLPAHLLDCHPVPHPTAAWERPVAPSPRQHLPCSVVSCQPNILTGCLPDDSGRRASFHLPARHLLVRYLFRSSSFLQVALFPHRFKSSSYNLNADVLSDV